MELNLNQEPANISDRPPTAGKSSANRLKDVPDYRPHGVRRNRDVSTQFFEMDRDFELISEDSSRRHVWLVDSGILRLQRFGYDGRRQILSMSLPGEIVGYDRPLSEGSSIQTATPCRLLRIDRREYDARLENDPSLRTAFYLQQQDQLDRLRWLIWSIGALRPDERLSAFLALSTLYMPYQPLPDGSGVLTVTLTRSDIADLLATTTETICRSIYRLEAAKVLEIRDPSHLRILDLKQLIVLGQIERSFEKLPFRDRRTNGRRNCLMQLACDNSAPEQSDDGSQ